MTAKLLTFEKFQDSQIKYIFSFMLLGSVVILLVNQPDLGQSILLIGSWVGTVFISGVSLIWSRDVPLVSDIVTVSIFFTKTE